MRLIDATRLVKFALIERDKIPLTVTERYEFGVKKPNLHGQSMRGGIRKILRLIEQAPTINAVPVVHYKDTNTTVLNVKSIEDWQDRIILDEGEESRSSAVYYTDSDDMVRVVRCKDCRYSEPMKKHGVYRFGESSLNCTQCRGDDGYGYAGISVVQPDDYCSDGALKDEEETTK